MEVLLAFLLKRSRAYLLAHGEQPLSMAQTQQWISLLARRQQGEPIAYLIGHCEFWSLAFQVNEHTLIPRPETEILVEWVLELYDADSRIKVLDLGTGSGAIALALATERPHWEITACDISDQALAVARSNAQQLNCPQVSFHKSDWFHSLPPQNFHMIVSNPPYIAEEDVHLQQGDVAFEPLLALQSGTDGLKDIQHITAQTKHFLKPGGHLLFEHGAAQAADVKTCLQRQGYQQITTRCDLAGHERCTGGLLTSPNAF